MPQANTTGEANVVALLRESIAALAGAIDSLGGKPSQAKTRYLFWTASFVNHTAAGFLALRELNLKSSKLLVRPCLEALFNVCATIKRQEFLFEKACAEWREENKFCPKDPSSIQEAEDALDQLRTYFGCKRSNADIRREKLSVEQTAKFAELDQVYNSAYRIYCQYTHGALKASVGVFDEVTNSQDTPYVTYVVLHVLRVLVEHGGAVCAHLDTLESLLQAQFQSGTLTDV